MVISAPGYSPGEVVRCRVAKRNGIDLEAVLAELGGGEKTGVEAGGVAGSVFLGPWTPESVGDYCSGTNHVLPTYGHARSYSGLSVDQFIRQMTVQELSADEDLSRFIL